MNVFLTEQAETGFDAAKARVEEDIKVALGSCLSNINWLTLVILSS